jgi:hypothetical protein
MNNVNKELSKEEKEEVETVISLADNNEFINHEEVIDIFLKWDSSF